MELSDLNIFRTVVEAGGVTRAAERLHRVQSNVTTRIRQLEDELGTALFIREGKRLHLSPAGRTLLDYADRLLGIAREAEDALKDGRPRGLLRLGAMESTAAVRLPAALSLYQQRYPEVTLELRTGHTQRMSAAVLAGEVDAALIGEPVAAQPFEKVPIYEEELVIVGPRGQAPILNAADAARCPLLVFEHGCPHRRRLEDWLAREEQMPSRLIEITSYHTMLGCAVIGMGIALLPKSVLGTFPEAKRLSLHAPPPGEERITTVLIWRKGAGSPKVSALVDVLRASRQPAASASQRRSRVKR